MRCIFLIFLIIGLLKANLYSEYKNFSSYQKRIMYKTFKKAKQFGLQYTLTAIAWQESQFGKYRINLKDGKYGSFGIFHNLLESVCDRHNCDTYWSKSRLAERLILDYDFSFSEALAEFKYWFNYWKSKGFSDTVAWKRAVCSYNAGSNWNNGLRYYRNIVKKIRFLHKLKDLK